MNESEAVFLYLRGRELPNRIHLEYLVLTLHWRRWPGLSAFHLRFPSYNPSSFRGSVDMTLPSRLVDTCCQFSIPVAPERKWLLITLVIFVNFSQIRTKSKSHTFKCPLIAIIMLMEYLSLNILPKRDYDQWVWKSKRHKQCSPVKNDSFWKKILRKKKKHLGMNYFTKRRKFKKQLELRNVMDKGI